MAGEWQTMKFENAPLEIIDGDRGTNYPNLTEFSKAGHCLFLNAGNVSANGFNFSDCSFVTAEKDASLRKGKLIRNDVVLTTRGTVGNAAYFDDSINFENIRINSGMVIFRAKTTALYPRFLYFFVRSALFREQVLALQTGSAQPQLPIRDINRIEIQIPPLPEQRAIAHILGTLDDKIELNRRMNETLEGMARAIFKSWFVDFDPVRARRGDPVWAPSNWANAQRAGTQACPYMTPEILDLFPDSFQDSELGQIPKGWGLARIAELSEINAWTLGKNDKISRIEYVEISEVVRGEIGATQIFQRGEEPSRARRRLRHGDTVMSTVRPERGSYFLCLNPSPSLIASTGFAVFTPVKAPWSFIHTALTQPEIFEHLGHQADGGAYPAVRPEVIGKWQVALPDKVPIMDEFHRICAPIYERVNANRHESHTLATIRDALLPKLLSGEIRINESENFIGGLV
ncbi:MAG: restriction endonuclease subunit S [Nitrospinae bacterium]|nr:restriction endonuclease subunit S [Nitrospinota bacterium]